MRFKLTLLLISSWSLFGNTVGRTVPLPKYESDEDPVRMIDNTGIEFEYELGDTTEFNGHRSIRVDWVVKNKTGKEVCYISETCNQLDYFLVVVPKEYQISPFIYCNQSFPVIRKISIGDSISSSTTLLEMTDSKPIEQIGLDFRRVDRFISFDSLKCHLELINHIHQKPIAKNNILWGHEK